MIPKKVIALLEKLVVGKLDREHLIKSLGKKYNFKEFLDFLNEAISIKDSRLFHLLFWYLPVSISGIQKDIIFKKYITKKEHYEHEEMLSYFHKSIIKPHETITILKELIINPPSYFYLDDSVDVFINKCLFTISKQPFKLAKLTLEDFTHSNNVFISKRSSSYLKKILDDKSNASR